VLNTGSASTNTTLNSAAARPLISADAGVKTSCNVTTPKSATDSSVCQSATFTHDEFDDDFEPMPFCKLLQLWAALASSCEFVCLSCLDCQQ